MFSVAIAANNTATAKIDESNAPVYCMSAIMNTKSDPSVIRVSHRGLVFSGKNADLGAFVRSDPGEGTLSLGCDD
jgi:hypothetical protein